MDIHVVHISIPNIHLDFESDENDTKTNPMQKLHVEKCDFSYNA